MARKLDPCRMGANLAQGITVMDDSKNILASLIFSTLFLFGVVAHGMDMEFISLQQKAELEQRFAVAKFEMGDVAKVTNKKWSCDMYGIRSRLQVQRKVNLYSLNKESQSGAFVNSGAQVVSQYTSKDNILKGQNERFEDQIRLTAEGQLISRLTSLKPVPSVIAYSICSEIF